LRNTIDRQFSPSRCSGFVVLQTMMVATHSFTGNALPSAHQLSFEAGVLLQTVPASEANGWVWSTNVATLAQGYVPTAYLIAAEERETNAKMCEEIVWHVADVALLKAVDARR
jgi:hypothetical protein